MDNALFEYPLTMDEVREHARSATTDYGTYYVDEAAKSDSLDCLYLYPSGRRCLIGEVVFRARGVQLPNTMPSRGTTIIVGIGQFIDGGYVPVADYDVRDVLVNMQNAQDNGTPWGAIVESHLLQ